MTSNPFAEPLANEFPKSPFESGAVARTSPFEDSFGSTHPDPVARCADHIVHYWELTGKVPRPDELFKMFPGTYASVAEVAKLFNVRELQIKVAFRGVKWHQPAVTWDELLLIEAVMDPGKRGTLTTRLRGTGCSYARWRKLMRNKAFSQVVADYGSSILQDNIPDIKRSLFSATERGDVNAIKFALELTGEYDPNAKNTMATEAVLQAVVSIITKHVQDPDTLNRIALEMQSLMTKAVGRSIRGDIYEQAQIVQASDL